MSENSTTYLNKKVEEYKETQKQTSNDMEVFNHGFAEQMSGDLGESIKSVLEKHKNYFYETVAELDESEDKKLEITDSEEKTEMPNDELSENQDTKESEPVEDETEENNNETNEEKKESFLEKLFRIL